MLILPGVNDLLGNPVFVFLVLGNGFYRRKKSPFGDYWTGFVSNHPTSKSRESRVYTSGFRSFTYWPSSNYWHPNDYVDEWNTPKLIWQNLRISLGTNLTSFFFTIHIIAAKNGGNFLVGMSWWYTKLGLGKYFLWLNGEVSGSFRVPQMLGECESSWLWSNLFTKKSTQTNREVDTPPKTIMTMKKQPFEDVLPVKIGDFPLSW